MGFEETSTTFRLASAVQPTIPAHRVTGLTAASAGEDYRARIIFFAAGGLLGRNEGAVIDSYSTAAVTDAKTTGAKRFIEKLPKTIWAAKTAPARGAL